MTSIEMKELPGYGPWSVTLGDPGCFDKHIPITKFYKEELSAYEELLSILKEHDRTYTIAYVWTVGRTRPVIIAKREVGESTWTLRELP